MRGFAGFAFDPIKLKCSSTPRPSPIKGDLKYGFDRSNPDGGIHLHARKLVFIHPVTKENIEITAPTPNDSIWNAI